MTAARLQCVCVHAATAADACIIYYTVIITAARPIKRVDTRYIHYNNTHTLYCTLTTRNMYIYYNINIIIIGQSQTYVLLCKLRHSVLMELPAVSKTTQYIYIRIYADLSVRLCARACKRRH